MEIGIIYKAPNSEWLGAMWWQSRDSAAMGLEVWFIRDNTVAHGSVGGMGSKLMGALEGGGSFEEIPREAVVAAKLRVRPDWTRLDHCTHDGCLVLLFRSDKGEQVDEHNRRNGADGHRHTLQRPRNGDPAGVCKHCGIELFHNGTGGVTCTWNGIYCNDGPGPIGRTQLHSV